MKRTKRFERMADDIFTRLLNFDSITKYQLASKRCEAKKDIIHQALLRAYQQGRKDEMENALHYLPLDQWEQIWGKRERGRK